MNQLTVAGRSNESKVSTRKHTEKNWHGKGGWSAVSNWKFYSQKDASSSSSWIRNKCSDRFLKAITHPLEILDSNFMESLKQPNEKMHEKNVNKWTILLALCRHSLSFRVNSIWIILHIEFNFLLHILFNRAHDMGFVWKKKTTTNIANINKIKQAKYMASITWHTYL